MTAAVQISKLTASHAAPAGMAPTLDLFLAQQDRVKAPDISLPEAAHAKGREGAGIPLLVRPPLTPQPPPASRSWLGYSVAAIGHALLLTGALVYLGSAGAPQQTSEDTIEVEIIVEAPGSPGDRSEQHQAPTEPPVAEREPEPEPEKEPMPVAPEQAPPPVEPVAQQAPPEPEPRPEPEKVGTPPIEQRAQEAPPEPTPTEPPPVEKIEPPPTTEAESPVFIPPPKPAPAKPQRPRVAKEAQKPAKKPAARPVRSPPARARPNGGGGANGRQAVAGQNAMSIDAFRAAVIARIARNKPSTDLAALAQGVVVVTFGFSSGGAAQGPRVLRSSGNAILDNAALQTIRRASPFPPPPPGAPRSFNVPIRFNVR